MLRAVVYSLCLGALAFTASALMIDPAGPTTLGREYAPWAIGWFTTLIVFPIILIEEYPR